MKSNDRRRIFVINGSASANSSNHRLIEYIEDLTKDYFEFTIFDDLKSLPHFDPELSSNNPPVVVSELRNKIHQADGILISAPEYVFSIPSGLKNLIEWCVITTVFDNKPTGLITAAGGGEKAHEELQLIMKTLGTKFTPETTLLIQGVRGKINKQGEIIDGHTREELWKFVEGFRELV